MEKVRKSVCNVPDTKDENGAWIRSYLLTTEEAYICHHTKMGMLWNSINNRCNPLGKEQKLFPSYKSCTNDFSDFQVFGNWCDEQEGFRLKDDLSSYYWQLDKDILFPGNKSYSQATCCFVPDYINSLMLMGTCRTVSNYLPLGVSFHKSAGKFKSQCGGAKNSKYLGLFESPEVAHRAWQAEKVLQITIATDRYRLSQGSREDVIDALVKRKANIHNDILSGTITESI